MYVFDGDALYKLQGVSVFLVMLLTFEKCVQIILKLRLLDNRLENSQSMRIITSVVLRESYLSYA